MADEQKRDWIPDEEIENATIKWNFSNFAGVQNDFDGPGDHNFTIILDEEDATRLRDLGWAVKTRDGYEEGDPEEHTLRIKCSWAKVPPAVFFIKSGRRFRAASADMADIRRESCERLDVIITPSFWSQPGRSGVTAYVKEMYVQIKESRFAQMYGDLEEV